MRGLLKIIVVFSLSLACLSLESIYAIAATSLYVSPGASYNNDCSINTPCSLNKARDTVRQIKNQGAGDITIYLSSGYYFLNNTLYFNNLDSANAGQKITYKSWDKGDGKVPIISGAIVIQGWDYDEIDKYYYASVPDGMEFRHLYINNYRGTRARYKPLSNFTKVDSYGYKISSQDSANIPETYQYQIEAVSLSGWKSYRCPVDYILKSSNEIHIGANCWRLSNLTPSLNAPVIGSVEWLENAKEFIDINNEWYYDKIDKTIYYKPKDGVNPKNTLNAIFAPTVEELLAIEGTPQSPVMNLNFEGITFSHTTWNETSSSYGYPVTQSGYRIPEDFIPTYSVKYPPHSDRVKTPGAIRLKYTRGIVFKNCKFEHFGQTGLSLEFGTQNSTIVGNIFQDISSAAIHVGETSDESSDLGVNAVKNNIISNNYISDIGVEYFDTPAIIIGYTENTTVQNNEIKNIPYTGISIGLNIYNSTQTSSYNNKINKNQIGYLMRRLVDGGGIYTLGYLPSTQITNNFIHNQINKHASIYFDNGSFQVSAFNNVSRSIPYSFLMQTIPPPAINNSLFNNYFDTDKYICTSPNNYPCTYSNYNNFFSSNIAIPDGSWGLYSTATSIINSSGIESSIYTNANNIWRRV